MAGQHDKAIQPIAQYTANSIEASIEEVRNHPEHPMQQSFLGQLQCIIGRLNNEELATDMISDMGEVAENIADRVRKGI